MRKLLIPLIALIVGFGAVVPSYARVDLSADPRINRELTAAAVADLIRQQCPTISGRMFVAMSKMMSLQSYAMSLGYSYDELKAFVNDKKQINRVMAMRNEYLSNNGVVRGDKNSYCRLGEREINSHTLIGSVLKKN